MVPNTFSKYSEDQKRENLPPTKSKISIQQTLSIIDEVFPNKDFSIIRRSFNCTDSDYSDVAKQELGASVKNVKFTKASDVLLYSIPESELVRDQSYEEDKSSHSNEKNADEQQEKLHSPSYSPVKTKHKSLIIPSGHMTPIRKFSDGALLCDESYTEDEIYINKTSDLTSNDVTQYAEDTDIEFSEEFAVMLNLAVRLADTDDQERLRKQNENFESNDNIYDLLHNKCNGSLHELVAYLNNNKRKSNTINVLKNMFSKIKNYFNTNATSKAEYDDMCGSNSTKMKNDHQTANCTDTTVENSSSQLVKMSSSDFVTNSEQSIP